MVVGSCPVPLFCNTRVDQIFDLMKTNGLGGKAELGAKVTVNNKSISNVPAILKFMGPLEGETGEWVGLELIDKEGNHSGVWKDKVYFTTTGSAKTGVFVRAKDVTLANGKTLDGLNKPSNSPQHTKDAVKDPKIMPKVPSVAARKDDKDVSSGAKKPAVTGGSKVVQKTASSALKTAPKEKEVLKTELDNAGENERYEERIFELEMELKEARDSPINQENETLRAKVKELEDSNHRLSMAKERMEHQVQEEKESKLNELSDQISFFKKSKEDSEKERKKLQNKISQLEGALDEHADDESLIESLNDKVLNLEAKNDALRTDLESARTQLKNTQSGVSTGEGKNEEYYKEEIQILNETVVVLESEAQKLKEKLEELEKEKETNASKLADFSAIEKKLRQKEKEASQLKESLDEQGDAISFVQQLSLIKLKIEEELKAAREKINDLLNEKDISEQVQLEQEEIARELEHEIAERDIEIQRAQQRLKDKDSDISDGQKQILKYKDRISMLLKLAEQNNSITQLKNSRENREAEEEPETPLRSNNSQLMDMIRFSEAMNQKFMKTQTDNILLRNKAGVFLLNLLQALPEEFTQQFYPEAVDTLVQVKTAKDKVFLLFEWIFAQLREKSQLYTDENIDLTNRMLVLLQCLRRSSFNLLRIDILISNCETEEDLGNIVSHRRIKEQSVALNVEVSQLIERFVDNNVSSSMVFDKVEAANDQLESECANFTKGMSKDNETKLELINQIMGSLISAFGVILSYKLMSELKENAQIDSSLDTYMKRLGEYLRELCLNNHIRYKPKMKSLIDDCLLLKDVYTQLEAGDLFGQLENLSTGASDPIKILKDTILTSQSYMRDLILDLNEIELPDELYKLQNKLEGNVWSSKVVAMKEELLRVRQLVEQKAALEFELVEQKRKVLTQEKEIKDKNTVKDVLEKRIAEAELRAEEVTILKNTNQRIEAKIKSQKQNNKIMEEEIENLIKKKAIVQDENKKLKDALEQAPKTQTKTNSRQQSSVQFSLNNIPVQSLLKENSNLRNVDLREKVSRLKFSDVMRLNKNAPVDKHKAIRKQILSTIVELKIISPFDYAPNDSVSNLQKLYYDLERLNTESPAGRNTKLVEVGTVRLWAGANEAAGNNISVMGYSQLQNMLPDWMKP